MPKLSVYVPDDLWERARAVRPANTSLIVQEALSLLVRTKSTEPAYSGEAPVGTELTRDFLKSQFSQQARWRFEEGYRSGLDYLQASQIPWKAFESFAEAGFDLRRWIASWFDEEVEEVDDLEPDGPDWLVRLGEHKYLGELAKRYGYHRPHPDRTYLLGFSRALRDVWRSVEYGSEPEAVHNQPQPPGKRRSKAT
jgi:hypothetical protein